MLQHSDTIINSIFAKLTEEEVSVLMKLITLSNNNGNTIEKKKSPFTIEEDNKLKRLVSQYDDNEWAKVAMLMEGRTQRQCRERYKHYLSPNVNNGKWTEDEDKLLLEKYDIYGPKWAIISKYFKSRTDINIKNRWIVLMRRNALVKSYKSQQNERPDIEKDQKRMAFHNKNNDEQTQSDEDLNIFDSCYSDDEFESYVSYS